MATFNKVILLGNLTRDPELRYTPGGAAVTDLSLAINRTFSTRDGESREETVFIDVTVWDRQAETCCQYLKKGRQVYIEGRITTRQYDAKDGSGKRYTTEIVAQTVQFLGGRAGAAGAQDEAPSDFAANAPTPMDDEDIPF